MGSARDPDSCPAVRTFRYGAGSLQSDSLCLFDAVADLIHSSLNPSVSLEGANSVLHLREAFTLPDGLKAAASLTTEIISKSSFGRSLSSSPGDHGNFGCLPLFGNISRLDRLADDVINADDAPVPAIGLVRPARRDVSSRSLPDQALSSPSPARNVLDRSERRRVVNAIFAA